jgi:7,8-dihydropterin-6-yl-methyl-4-(beta-D-ribofuranosyl)aminobenzene 5'-phosphate synthase
MKIREVDKVEITTLQDNYVDLVSRDNSAVVMRAMPLVGNEVRNSILAEHGFSAFVTVTEGTSARSFLFDFGFSAHGAAFNADALGLALSEVQVCVLSHGHLDHAGGMEQMAQKVGKKSALVVHPEAFRNPRYLKLGGDFKVFFPPLTRERAAAAGLSVIETRKPYPIIDDCALFLGEIPRKTEFEKGMPNVYYERDGAEHEDDLIDDSAVVMHVRGKGLVVLSGCAHSGIVNTVSYAREVTGVDALYVVMGGFHLTGPDMAPAIDPTTERLMAFDPTYIVPTHCTGRKAVMTMEQKMPDKFILNMSGTKLTFG